MRLLFALDNRKTSLECIYISVCTYKVSSHDLIATLVPSQVS